MATAVPLRRPASSITNIRSGVFNRRRMRPMFVLISSMNPSRGPLTAMEVCGSLTARRATFLVPRMIYPSTPPMTRAGLPAKISREQAEASSASRSSGKSSMRFASSREQGAGRSASGRAASMPISSLSVMPSAYTAAQGVPSPAENSYTRISGAGSSRMISWIFACTSAAQAAFSFEVSAAAVSAALPFACSPPRSVACTSAAQAAFSFEISAAAVSAVLSFARSTPRSVACPSTAA